MISKLPIDQQISWLISHSAGVMKAHAMKPEQQDFWQVVLNVAQEVSKLRRRVDRLEADSAPIGALTNALTRPIPGEHGDGGAP